MMYCVHPQVHVEGQRVTVEICQMCTRWKEPPPEKFRPFPPPKPRGRCVFRGAEIGLRECTACRGVVRVKVFACAHPAHSETTLAECAACPDHMDLTSEP
jgi:hypothetical protein